MADPAYVGENPYYVPLDYTYTPLSPGGGGGSGNGVGAGGGQPLQQLGIGPLATPQQQAVFGIDSLASSRGDTGRVQYGGPEGQLTGGGGVNTVSRLNRMSDDQIARSWSNLKNYEGVVAPNSPFGPTREQMIGDLEGTGITSIGAVDDLSIFGPELIGNLPFRQVGKIAKGVYEGATGYGQDSWDALQEWNKRLVALQRGETLPERKLPQSVIDVVNDLEIEESGEATAAPSITRSVNPLANVNIDERREARKAATQARAELRGHLETARQAEEQKGRTGQGGIGSTGHGRGGHHFAQGGLMSLAEGGRPGFARGRVVHPGGYAGDDWGSDWREDIHIVIPILDGITQQLFPEVTDYVSGTFDQRKAVREKWKATGGRLRKAQGGRIGFWEGGLVGHSRGGIASL